MAYPGLCEFPRRARRIHESCLGSARRPTATWAPERASVPLSRTRPRAFVSTTFAKQSAYPYQEPHAERPRGMLLEQAIGREVRRQREKLDVTISELAKAAGISAGMLSKIENGATSPSLSSLQALAQALQVPLTTFFRNFDEMRTATFVKAGQGLAIERRGTRAGHQYQLLGHVPAGALMVEPYLITLTAESDVFPTFQHSGVEFLYMLEGEVVYRHGGRTYLLTPGDSLYFDADAPHGPEELRRLPIRYLSVISYAREG